MIGIYIEGKITPNDNMTVAGVVNTIYKCLKPNCKIIHSYKGDKLKKILGDEVDDDDYIYYDKNANRDGWKNQFEEAKNLLKENDITSMIIFKSIIMGGIKSGDLNAIFRFMRKRKIDDFAYTKFEIMRIQLAKYLLIEASFLSNVKMYQFILDPQEPHFSDINDDFSCKYIYGMQRDGLYTYMPCFEYGITQLTKDFDLDKEYNLVFFCSCLTKDREFVLDYKDTFESIPNSMVQINTKKVKPLPQLDYYKLVGKSKFTICIPAYDKTAFSMYRFIESIAVDCLPLIHKDCCLDDVVSTFPDIYDIIVKEGLIIDFDNIVEELKSKDKKREQIIQDIKDTKSWKKFTDLNYVKKRWKRLCEQ